LAKLRADLQTQLPASPPQAPEDVYDVEVVETFTTETALVPVSPSVLPAPASPELAEVTALAGVFARSGFFSDARQMAQACVKILAGKDLGIPATQAMTGIYVVKGRITLSAGLMASLVRRHPRYDFRVVTHTEAECQIEFRMDGQPIGLSTFTMNDAQRAGLSGSETYKKYPRNMLFNRAMSNGVRWYCPDVFGAPMYTPDEIDATGTVIAEALVEAVAG
jgi:hypothetical protein